MHSLFPLRQRPLSLLSVRANSWCGRTFFTRRSTEPVEQTDGCLKAWAVEVAKGGSARFLRLLMIGRETPHERPSIRRRLCPLFTHDVTAEYSTTNQ